MAALNDDAQEVTPL